jgi:phage terminase Nu1 subunit (DNA packaging protein)
MSQLDERLLLTAHELAFLFGVRTETFRAWGVAPYIVSKSKSEPDRYLLKDVLQHRWRDADGDIIDIRTEQARLAKYNADRAKIELEAAQGRLMEVAAVQKAFDEIVVYLNKFFAGIPSRLAGRLENVSAKEAREILTQEIESGLNNAAAQLSGQIQGTATPKSKRMG